VRSAEGQVVEERRVPTDALDAYLRRRAKSRVIMETCTESFRIADQARAMGHEVRVVPASLVKSLGVYELRSKELLFAMPPVLERLSGRASPAPKPLAQARPDRPPPLCTLVDACLAYSQDARPGAEELVTALERIES
jgi:hypothetical protein